MLEEEAESASCNPLYQRHLGVARVCSDFAFCNSLPVVLHDTRRDTRCFYLCAYSTSTHIYKQDRQCSCNSAFA